MDEESCYSWGNVCLFGDNDIYMHSNIWYGASEVVKAFVGISVKC